MALQIQRPEIWANLQRLFRIVGKGKLELEQNVIPVVQVGDVSLGQLPPVVRSCSAAATIVPVAGELATVRFEVPGGVLAQIRRLHVWASGDCSFTGSFSSAGSAQAGTGLSSYIDGRLLQLGQGPAGLLTFGTQVAAIAPIQFVARVPTAQAHIFEFEHLVVGSGTPDQFGFAEFQIDAANTTMVFNIEWDEPAET